jgi:hypothetical protein
MMVLFKSLVSSSSLPRRIPYLPISVPPSCKFFEFLFSRQFLCRLPHHHYQERQIEEVFWIYRTIDYQLKSTPFSRTSQSQVSGSTRWGVHLQVFTLYMVAEVMISEWNRVYARDQCTPCSWANSRMSSGNLSSHHAPVT